MANQVYIIPRRNDLDGMNIQVTDLRPNTSQRNLIYDGAGQSGYEKWSLDVAGPTQVLGDAYTSGSTNTLLAANLVADNTGVVVVFVPGTAALGLASYLRDRVHVNPSGVNRAMLFGEANTIAAALQTEVALGQPLDLTAINTVMNVTLPGVDSDLDGAGAASLSFGLVEDVLRILQGQTYLVPALTIMEDAGNVFMGAAARAAAVAAATSGEAWAVSGAFVARGEPGFRDFRPILRSGSFNISNGEGVLAGLKGSIAYMNPNYAYNAADVTPFRPRAIRFDGAVVPADGDWFVLACYDHLGNVL